MSSIRYSKNAELPPLGQVLKISSKLNGMTQVKLDNGPFQMITLHCRTEGLADLMSADLRAVQAHLMSRRPGRFRTKGTK